jgi:hypothetical protein
VEVVVVWATVVVAVLPMWAVEVVEQEGRRRAWRADSGSWLRCVKEEDVV